MGFLSLTGDLLPLRPNPGPEAVPPGPPWLAGLALALVGLVLAALAAVLWTWLRRPRRVPPPLPHEWARAEFARLAAVRCTDRAAVELLYVRLSAVLREYLSLRFGLQAPAQTTEEFLGSLQQSDRLLPLQKDRLAAFLKQADLVKFAQGCPTEDEVRAGLAAARQFIEETAPDAPAAAGQASGA
jgi:hypothetical protein